MTETETRKRLLLIDEEFPWPLNSGKRLRTYNLLRGLTRFYDITYLAYGEPDSPAFRQLAQDGLNPIAVRPPDRRQSGPKFYARLFLNLFSPYPYIVTSHYTRRFQSRLHQELDAHRYDAVICEWTPYTRFVKDLSGIRKIVNTHNIEAAIWRRYQQQEKSLVRRLYISLQRAKVENFETRCFHWLDGATAVSDAEARSIANLGVPYPVAAVDNGVDTDYFACAANADPNLIIFSGAMDWRPNQDAALYFTEQILPRIRSKCPGAAFTIVGRTPPRQIQDLAKINGVTVTGTVDDVRPWVGRAAALVVPLRIGGGSRLKILEGMAMHKPIVSTAVGAEGLRVTDGRDILLADDPDDFADAVVRCLTDPGLRTRLGDNGRELVEREYRWDILARKMHEYLCRVLNGK